MSRKARPSFARVWGQPSHCPNAPNTEPWTGQTIRRLNTGYITRFTAPEPASIYMTSRPFRPSRHRLHTDEMDRRYQKSLKLYLASFSQLRGTFHEDLHSTHRRDLVRTCSAWLGCRIGGAWFPRGGCPINVF